MKKQSINDAGIALIKQYEGFSPRVYICPGGYETIGYGHKILRGEHFGRDISEEEATELLQTDIFSAEKCVNDNVDVAIDADQFSALVSFIYNIGSSAFLSSTLLKKVNAGEHHAVPDEFRRWVWSNGKKLAGLEKHRESEATLYIRNI